MPEMIFMYGFPASGKTTFSQHLITTDEYKDYKLISADQIRLNLYDNADSYGDPQVIYKKLLRQMKECYENGISFIYDGVNMKKDYRMDFLNEIKNWQAPIGEYFTKTLVKMPATKEVCKKRFLERKRKIPFSAVEHYFCMDANERPTYKEGWDYIYTCANKIYLAATFFADEHRTNVLKAADILRHRGLEVYVPMEHQIKDAWDYPNHEWGRLVYENDIKAIDEADTIVMLCYGRNMTTDGTTWEAGYAFGTGKRVLVVEMPEAKLMSLMIMNGSHAVLSNGLDSLKDYDFISMPKLKDLVMEQK